MSDDTKNDTIKGGVVEIETDVHPQITLTINVEDILKSELGWQEVYDYDGPVGVQPGGNGRLIDLVADTLALRLADDVRSAVEKAVKEIALAKVDSLIDQVMVDPVILVKPGGAGEEATNLRAAMVKAMKDRLDQRVDSNGKPAFGTGRTYLDWHVEKAAREVLDQELSTTLLDFSRKIREETKALVRHRVAEALGKGL